MPKARIVIVEDEAIIAMDIAETLKRLDYFVAGIEATAGAAIELVDMVRPDLVLMDIRLRGPASGIEAAMMIRERFGTPVVFLTAHADAKTVERALPAAPYGYVVKPFAEHDLHRAVEVALSRHEVEKEERRRADEELWQSEERFRLLVDAVQDYAIIILDLEGRIVSWNRGAERLSGFTADEAIGQSIAILYPPDERDPLRILRELELARENGRLEMEAARVRKDASKFWVHSVRTPIVDRTSRVCGYAAVMRDISERRALEAQLLQAQKLDSLGKLAGGVAHDFNNMLMVIFSRTDLLTRAVGGAEPQSRYISDIRAAALKSRDLTQQLLAAARRQVLQPEAIDLNEVVRTTLKLLTPSLGEHIVIRTELQEPLWQTYADPGKLHQVLINLALNARDAMTDGGVLTIETHNTRADRLYVQPHANLHEGEYVSLIVTDTGIGISADVRDQVYDPFFTTKSFGSGLGLAVVRGIVEQTGGHIWLYSEEGQGTTFKIFFPRYQDIMQPRAASEPEALLERGDETILLVEDEELLRTIVRETLQENGYTVLDAPTPVDALAVSAKFEGTIDLLLTDVIMPGMNGSELAAKLVEQRPSLRVVYMSGYTDNAIVHRGVLDEGVRFIEKPATTGALLRAVREALQ